MADEKISLLPELITPLAADLFAVVDIAAGPITKKITLANLATAIGISGNFVTLDTAQTITGAKTFNSSGVQTFEDDIFVRSSNSIFLLDSLNTSFVEINNQTSILQLASAGSTVKLLLNGLTLALVEQSAAPSDVVAQGQFWVRDDVPNVPMFTDDLGTDFVLTAASLALNDLTDVDTGVVTTGGFLIRDPTEYVLTVSTTLIGSIFRHAGEIRASVFDAYRFLDEDPTTTNPVICARVSDFDTGLGSGAVDQLSVIAGGVEGIRITEAAAAITVDVFGVLTVTQSGGGANDLLELEESTDNNRLVIRYDGSSIWEFRDAAAGAGNDWIRLNEAGGGVDLLHNSSIKLSTVALGVNIENNLKVGLATFGSIKINEGANAAVDEDGYGQIWTRNDVPNTLMFTDDVGTDFIIGGAISAAYTRNAAIVEDRTLLASASATTINNNNVLAALIADLQTRGDLG